MDKVIIPLIDSLVEVDGVHGTNRVRILNGLRAVKETTFPPMTAIIV